MKFHLLVGATMFAAALASSSVRGGESKDAAAPGAGVPARTSQLAAPRASPAAHAGAAARRRNGTPYRSANETFAGISRGAKGAAIASDDWSTRGSPKPSKGKPVKKDPSK